MPCLIPPNSRQLPSEDHLYHLQWDQSHLKSKTIFLKIKRETEWKASLTVEETEPPRTAELYSSPPLLWSALFQQLTMPTTSKTKENLSSLLLLGHESQQLVFLLMTLNLSHCFGKLKYLLFQKALSKKCTQVYYFSYHNQFPPGHIWWKLSL